MHPTHKVEDCIPRSMISAVPVSDAKWLLENVQHTAAPFRVWGKAVALKQLSLLFELCELKIFTLPCVF